MAEEQMTEDAVRGFCQNNGINVSPIGSPLRVLDPTELPGSVRKFVNDDGTYKGKAKPAEDTDAVDAEAGETEVEDLTSGKTVVELKDQARDLEIPGFSSMTKSELVKAIKKASK